jgi:hypothetical protein
LLKDETAGDPMSEQKWHRSSLRHLMEKMEQLGYWISHTTIARLLEKLGYSLKANEKRLSGSDHPDRDRQFRYIATQKALFQKADLPRISVDTKKKELIGNFKNQGQEWCLNARAVNDHDFEQDALGKAVPYGIYDLKYNRGYVYVGQSADHRYQHKARLGDESTWEFDGLVLRFSKRGTALSANTIVEIACENAEVSVRLICSSTANLRMVAQARTMLLSESCQTETSRIQC